MEDYLLKDAEIVEQEAVQNQRFDELDRILFESGSPGNVSFGNPGDEFDNFAELAASWTEASIPFLSQYENDVFESYVSDNVFGILPVLSASREVR